MGDLPSPHSQAFVKPVPHVCPAYLPAAALTGCLSPTKGSKGQVGDQQRAVHMWQFLPEAERKSNGIKFLSLDLTSN